MLKKTPKKNPLIFEQLQTNLAFFWRGFLPTVKLTYYLLSNQLIDSVDETSNSSTSIATTTTTPKNVQAEYGSRALVQVNLTYEYARVRFCCLGQDFAHLFELKHISWTLAQPRFCSLKKSKGAPLLSYPVACSTFCKKKQTYRNRISLSEIIFFFNTVNSLII